MQKILNQARAACSEDSGIGLVPQELYDSVSSQRVKGELSHRVVAAWEPCDLAGHPLTLKLVIRLLREFRKECEVIASRDHQGPAIRAAKPLNKRIGADRRPEKTQPLKVNCAFQGLPYVLRRKPCPDDIGEKTRDMYEHAGRKALVMGERQKPDA